MSRSKRERVTVESMPPGMRFFWGIVFPQIFILAGAWVSYLGVQNLMRARESVDWPKAPGRILSSRVSTDVGDGDTSTTYSTRIEYEFFVHGQKFAGTRVAYGTVVGGSYGSRGSAEKIVERYPKDKHVDVFYLRSEPEVCVLEPGLKKQAWFIPVLGLFFMGVGMVLAIILYRGLYLYKHRQLFQ